MSARLMAVAAAAAVLLTGAAGAQGPGLRQLDAPYVPTPQNVVEAMLDLARVTSRDVVYDLGSGDGRIPITAAVKYGALGVGVEIDALRIRDALDNLKRAGAGGRVRFLHQDLFETPVGEATVVTLFLLPRVLQELMPRLQRELRPGSRVVSHMYHMGEQWPPDAVREVNNLTIYLWIIR